MLAERLYEKGPAFAEAWNFGPSDDDAKPVQWIVEALCRKWGAGAGFTLDSSAHAQPHEARYLKLDCSKANTILGWKPRWSLDVALDKIVEWNRAFAAKSDLAAMCSGQIEEYVQ
jgi:CDP-glucose 4,6-dehydratase